MKHTNIVVILTDNQRYDGLGCTGHPVCRTPGWDALASEGVFFDGLRTTSPVCSPARASLWTGLEPHRAGLCTVIHPSTGDPSDDPYRPAASTGISVSPLPYDLREKGYQTFLAGKWHVGDEWLSKSFDRTGGSNFHGLEYKEWCQSQGMPDGFILNDPERCKPFRSPRPPHMSVPHVALLDIPEAAEYNRWILDQALELLPEVNKDQPFFFNLSFYGVHPPFFLPQHVLDLYGSELAQEPENWRPSSSEPALYARSYYRKEWSEWGEDFEAWKKATAASWAYTTYIDGLVSEFVQALREHGLLDDDTLLALGSDHGDMMGQHGLWQKFCPYEEAVRVPLVLRWPAHLPAGQRIDSACSLQDFGNSLRQAAGLEPRGTALPGADRNGQERDIFIQYDQPRDWDAWQPLPAWRTIQRGNWKFTLHGNGEEEMYDLQSDIGEISNLAAETSSRSRKEELRTALHKWGKNTNDRFPYEQH